MDAASLSRLALRAPVPPVTRLLIVLNLLVFAVMLWNGAGFWHSPNTVQLTWGANFAPATADGEWWRLASAMFLHFGAVHLGMNMLALWDGGKLVERMYGGWRFLSIYLVSGVAGNLLSLVIQGNQAVSGGASGAIFGIYGALLVYLWLFRRHMQVHEFRWLFWGALLFSLLTIGMGYIITGIDRQFPHLSLNRMVVAPVVNREYLVDGLSSSLYVPVNVFNLEDIVDLPANQDFSSLDKQAMLLPALGAALRQEAA